MANDTNGTDKKTRNPVPATQRAERALATFKGLAADVMETQDQDLFMQYGNALASVRSFITQLEAAVGTPTS